jgi:DNA polymerase-3 subunit epsilon
LCKRFDVSLESRTKHGALIDAYLLAEVYLELNGGREQGLSFRADGETATVTSIRPARRARSRSNPGPQMKSGPPTPSLSRNGRPALASLGLLKADARKRKA